MIRILQRKQINNERWNNLIAASGNESIYPYTWYLDACADNWMAFVMNDYEYVMPVAFRKKLMFKYTYQPIYCQQLGVHSKLKLDPEIIRDFLLALKKNFKMGDYSFNEGNLLGDEQGFEVNDSLNYILPLDNSYEFLHRNYNENCRRNIKKSLHTNVDFSDKIAIDEIISLKKMCDAVKRGDEHYRYIKNILTLLQEKDKIKILGVRSGTHLMAAAAFVYSDTRSIFLLSASSEQGKEYRAMFRIVDSFIQLHAGQSIKLDFEGSNIASIARFFRGFGAKPEVYQRINFENPASKIVKNIKGV